MYYKSDVIFLKCKKKYVIFFLLPLSKKILRDNDQF